MSEEKDDELVTTIKAVPDLSGLKLFQAEIEACEVAVNSLDKAIKSLNTARPRTPRASRGGRGPATGTAVSPAALPVLATGGALALLQGASQGTSRSVTTGKRQPRRAGGGTGVSVYSGGGGGVGAYNGGSLPFGEGYGWKPGTSFGESPASPGARPGTGGSNKNAWGKSSGGGGRYDGVNAMMGGAAVAYTLMQALSGVADNMDKINIQVSQLDRLPQTLGDARKELLDLNAAASDVRGDVNSFVSAYTNMATSTKKQGFTKEQLIQATQGLTGSLALGGASEQAKSNALYQMGQAFSSDRFGGDEFRSFMEAIGTQANEVAAAFGTDVKGLRAMSQAGKLTAEVVVKAFMKLGGTVQDQIKKTGWTWGQLTTVMSNDWTAMLTDMTSGGDWQKLTDWLANNVMPIVKEAEKWFAQFWKTTTDQSKANVLIGILAAIGAAFTALAIPVIAATWPFIAFAAAVWLVFEAVSDFKSWLDGNGGNIFSSMFGSFEEFKKQYPNIATMLDSLADKAKSVVDYITAANNTSEKERDYDLTNPANAFKIGMPNLLNGLDWLMGGGISGGNKQTQANVTNTYQPQITVNNQDEASKVLSSTYNDFDKGKSWSYGSLSETAGTDTE